MSRPNSIMKKTISIVLSFLLIFSFFSTDDYSIKSFAYEETISVEEIIENSDLEITEETTDVEVTDKDVIESGIEDENIVVAIISTIVVFIVTLFMIFFVKDVAEKKQKNKN